MNQRNVYKGGLNAKSQKKFTIQTPMKVSMNAKSLEATQLAYLN